MERYARNLPYLDERDQSLLAEKAVAVVGLGGLGGHVAEQLARMGVGRLVLIDGDVVEESNLNRQVFATERTLGMPKTQAAQQRLGAVNSTVICTLHPLAIDDDNGQQLLCGADMVIDGLDNTPSRLCLERLCEKLAIPLVHGAIGGCFGQVAVIRPGDRVLARMLPTQRAAVDREPKGCPAFMPAIIASIQVAEAIGCLLGRPSGLEGRLLRMDLHTHAYTLLDIRT